jgi:hypothetical protein
MKLKKAAPVKSLKEPECPECDRMFAVHSDSQAQGEFLAWLQEEKHFTLCERMGDSVRLCPIHASVEKLLAEFHGIDLNKAEAERRALLEFLRNQQH